MKHPKKLRKKFIFYIEEGLIIPAKFYCDGKLEKIQSFQNSDSYLIKFIECHFCAFVLGFKYLISEDLEKTSSQIVYINQNKVLTVENFTKENLIKKNYNRMKLMKSQNKESNDLNLKTVIRRSTWSKKDSKEVDIKSDYEQILKGEQYSPSIF